MNKNYKRNKKAKIIAVTYRIDAELYEQFKKKCEKKKVTFSKQTEHLIKKFVKKHKWF